MSEAAPDPLAALHDIRHALTRPGILCLRSALDRLLEVQAIALAAIERAEAAPCR